MKVKLAYGKYDLEVELPDNSVVIEPQNLPALMDEKQKALEALRNPIGTPPLKSMVKRTDNVAIVISDITRPTPNYKLIPWIMEELGHVPRENFVIINGTGSHRENTREELIVMLGEKIVNNLRVVNNNAFDKSSQTFLGKSSKGAEVYLNSEYVKSDFKIITGFIEPHFFAGFSGGPKGVMPGIAGIETIMNFHSAKLIGHRFSNWGVIEGNPIQEEATEIAQMSKPDFLLNITLNGDKKITRFFAGDIIKAHRAGCEYVIKHAMVVCDNKFDIVVTTNSGYPLDQNLYQSVKGISAAYKIVKKGGAIICATECSDGLPNHGNYAKILKMCKTPQELLDKIESPSFQMFDQWQVQKQAMIQKDANVYIYSTLDDEVVEQAMFIPIHDIENCVHKLLERHSGEASIAVMPFGPLTIPYVKDIAAPQQTESIQE
jgi:nickel-dependent lactate racemase